MFPCESIYDGVYGRFCNSKSTSYFRIRDFKACFHGSYLTDFPIIKLCKCCIDSESFNFTKMMTRTTVKPSFFRCVSRIFFMSSRKQMTWPDTFPVVALMAHKFSTGWIRSTFYEIAYSVSRLAHLIYSAAIGERAVSTFVNRPNPLPTLSDFWNMFWNRPILIYFCPKPSNIFFGKFHKTKNHRPAKVISAQMKPQSQDGEINLFVPSTFTAISRLIAVSPEMN